MIKCKTICHNYLCTKSFILFIFKKKKKNQISLHFPVVKVNANNAEICKVGNLEEDFLLVTLVQFFLNFFQILF